MLGLLKALCNSGDLSVKTKINVLASVCSDLLRAAQTWTLKTADVRKYGIVGFNVPIDTL